MSAKISFTSVTLESFGRSKANGGAAQFAASWNQKTAESMGWTGDIPAYLAGTDLDGDLAATILTLTPNNSELKKHAIEIAISRVHKFETVRLELEGKKGKGFRTELRFKIKFADVNGCKSLERFMASVGEEKSTMAVSYEPQMKQADLITEDQRSAASANQDAMFQ